DTFAHVRNGHCRVRQLGVHRRHAHRGNAARHDEVEVTKIGRDVERKAVPGDPIARVNADRRNLAVVDPDAGVWRPPTALQPKGGERLDEKLLNLPQIPMQILAVALEVDDWIADEL